MNGKGDAPRNCFSERFRMNFDAIKWRPDPMAAPVLSEDELHILQHALGSNQYGETGYTGHDENDGCFGYPRNRFYTSPESSDGATCERLIRYGYMNDRGPIFGRSSLRRYVVTGAGVAAVKQHSPTQRKVTS